MNTPSNERTLRDFATDMRIGKRSERTIGDRMRLLRCLARYLDDTPLLAATEDQLRAFQATYAHRAPATVDVYTRHMQALYAWARKRHRILIDPAIDLDRPIIPRGRPHPTMPDQLRLIFACTRGPLRLAYVLGTFAGLRCGEMTRLRREDLDLDTMTQPTALIRGKGGHERTVPLLPPVLDELYAHGLPRSGWLLLRDGRPYTPAQLSLDSHHHLARLGMETTLHSTRHFFATWAGRITRDPMFVKEILGHANVATTQIYMQTSLADAHERLSGMCSVAADLLGKRAAGGPRSLGRSGQVAS